MHRVSVLYVCVRACDKEVQCDLCQLTCSVFAWESYEQGSDIHPLADPTKLELMHSEFKKKKENFKGDQQQSILEKYGGEEHLDAPPKALLLAQTVRCSPVFSLVELHCTCRGIGPLI